MEYTVQKLAALAGVSARTLRYYDQIGLLHPKREQENGYRIYGNAEVDALQQILFYKELGMELSDIRQILQNPSFDRLAALRSHQKELELRHSRLESLLCNVEKTIEQEEGKRIMSDNEKFEGFKQEWIDANEDKYGPEIRKAYGETAVDESNAKLIGLSKAEFDSMQALGAKINALLEEAVQSGEKPTGETGAEIAALHKQWLCFTWPKYSREAHLGLAEAYVADERFTAYYDKTVPGCAAFLRDAIQAFA